MVGDWKQHEVWDGTYTYGDLLDWYEMRAVKNENQRRSQVAAEIEAEARSRNGK